MVQSAPLGLYILTETRQKLLSQLVVGDKHYLQSAVRNAYIDANGIMYVVETAARLHVGTGHVRSMILVEKRIVDHLIKLPNQLLHLAGLKLNSNASIFNYKINYQRCVKTRFC